VADTQGDSKQLDDLNTCLIAIMIKDRFADLYIERHGHIVILESEGTEDRYVVTVTKQLKFDHEPKGAFFDEARQSSGETP
jgi:hypothetical protein